jgi:hypothetical protein
MTRSTKFSMSYFGSLTEMGRIRYPSGDPDAKSLQSKSIGRDGRVLNYFQIYPSGPNVGEQLTCKPEILFFRDSKGIELTNLVIPCASCASIVFPVGLLFRSRCVAN